VNFALKQETHITSVAMETKQLVPVCMLSYMALSAV